MLGELQIAYVSVLVTERVEVNFDAVVRHSLHPLRALIVLVYVHRNFVTQILPDGE